MHQPLKAGSIASLHRYPVKSMMGEELNATRIGSKGIEGDRVFALLDPDTGKIASAKNPSKWPTLFQFRAAFTAPLGDHGPLPPVRITFPDGSTISTEDSDIESRLAAVLAKPVRFLKGAPSAGTLEEYWPDIEGLARRDVVTDEAMPAETFFDVGIVHLLTTATMDNLRAQYPAGRFETRRFRPNTTKRESAPTPPSSPAAPSGAETPSCWTRPSAPKRQPKGLLTQRRGGAEKTRGQAAKYDKRHLGFHGKSVSVPAKNRSTRRFRAAPPGGSHRQSSIVTP
jgi:hypothetical protein